MRIHLFYKSSTDKKCPQNKKDQMRILYNEWLIMKVESRYNISVAKLWFILSRLNF